MRTLSCDAKAGPVDGRLLRARREFISRWLLHEPFPPCSGRKPMRHLVAEAMDEIARVIKARYPEDAP